MGCVLTEQRTAFALLAAWRGTAGGARQLGALRVSAVLPPDETGSGRCRVCLRGAPRAAVRVAAAAVGAYLRERGMQRDVIRQLEFTRR
jgi:hypothetical protein